MENNNREKYELNKEYYERLLNRSRERYRNMTPEERKEYCHKNYLKLKARLKAMSPEDRYEYYNRRNQKYCAKRKGMTVQEYKEYQIQKQINRASESLNRYQSKLAELQERKEKLNK